MISNFLRIHSWNVLQNDRIFTENISISLVLTSYRGININPPLRKNSANFSSHLLFFTKSGQMFVVGNRFYSYLSNVHILWPSFLTFFPCKYPKTPKIFRAARAIFGGGFLLFTKKIQMFRGGFFCRGVLILIPR